MNQDDSPPRAYANRFQSGTDVRSYEVQEYAPTSYSSRIWELQQPALAAALTTFKSGHSGKLRLLDFACGSGRILSFVERVVDSAEGVDISASMAELARLKCPRASVCVGDILSQPELLTAPYDIITSFRFLLNVEAEIRYRALRRLREVIRQPRGLLIVNVHGNTHSLRHPAIAWNRWREEKRPAGSESGKMLNEMTLLEAGKLLSDSGFEVLQVLGFGVLPPTLYRTPLRGLARAVDRFFAKQKLLSKWSVDLILICQPKPNA